MPLSQADLDDVRRYAGYPVQSALMFVGDVALVAYSNQLDLILAGLTDSQISVLQTRYLVPLRALEAAIIAAGDNLDTDRAAVWFHNRTEVQDRVNLFNYTRENMCFSLGIPPGSLMGLPGGGGSPLAPAVFIV